MSEKCVGLGCSTWAVVLRWGRFTVIRLNYIGDEKEASSQHYGCPWPLSLFGSTHDCGSHVRVSRECRE